MTTVALKNMTDEFFDRMFALMVGVSAVAHVLLLVLALILPPLFSSPRNDEDVIRIEMLVKELPKGPNIGTEAPTRSLTEARAPNPESIKKNELTGMAMKQRERQIKSNRLNYKQRERQDAIERIKNLREVKDGGGGEGKESGGNVFSIYLARVKKRIEDVWSLPPGLTAEEKSKKVYCRVKIGANGAILSASVSKSSGIPHLDRSALAAISAAGALPQPPPLLANELASKGMVVTFDPLRK